MWFLYLMGVFLLIMLVFLIYVGLQVVTGGRLHD